MEAVAGQDKMLAIPGGKNACLFGGGWELFSLKPAIAGELTGLLEAVNVCVFTNMICSAGPLKS